MKTNQIISLLITLFILWWYYSVGSSSSESSSSTVDTLQSKQVQYEISDREQRRLLMARIDELQRTLDSERDRIARLQYDNQALRWALTSETNRCDSVSADLSKSRIDAFQQWVGNVSEVRRGGSGIAEHAARNTSVRIGDTIVHARRALRFSIVIPFPPKQTHFVLDNIGLWSSYHFFPCAMPHRYAAYIDLIFYVSTPDAESEAKIEKMSVNSTWAKHCFNSISFRSIDMDKKTDEYGPGTLAMFYSVFEADFFVNNDYMLWMEPDLVPLRRLWLDHLYEQQLVFAPPFWQKGSVPRYPNSEGDVHINGNALYATNSARFSRFVLASQGAFTAYLSFDQSLFAHYQKSPNSIAHQFVYTESIQNRGYELFNLSTLLAEEPSVYLAHGKGVLASCRAFIEGN